MKKSYENIYAALCALSILISFDVNASSYSSSNPSTQPGNQTSPSASEAEILSLPESINACVGKNEGDICIFKDSTQKVSGKCEKNKEGKMNCTIPNS